MTREQFIERRRQAAIARGADPERAAANAARIFAQIDMNHDGILDPSERAAWRASHPGQNPQANPAQWQQPALRQ